MERYIPTLRRRYQETIVSNLMQEFSFTSVMRVPKLLKIVVNQGVGKATLDKKQLEAAQNQLSAIVGQHAVITVSQKDISNFKLRRGNPVGIMVTLRRDRMYEFLDRLINISLPRIRDFQGVPVKFDGHGNFSIGIREQILFPEVDIDKIDKILGLQITFVTSAQTDEEGYALLREFGIPFKNLRKK